MPSASEAAPLLVLYKMEGCPYCTPLVGPDSPLLKLSVPVRVADSQENASLMALAGVQSFPTLQLFAHGKVYAYEGPRTLSAMQSWIQKLLGK